MNERGTFIAQLLDSMSRALAAGAVNRMREGDDPAAMRAREASFTALVADTEMRVRHLAEALAAGRPELFRLDVEWLRATYAARGESVVMVEASLAALRDELGKSLPEDVARTAQDVVEAALGEATVLPASTESLLADGAPHVELARTFLLALLEGRNLEAQRLVLDALEEGVSIAEIHVDVIARSMREIGRMWQMGELHVGEEHLGSRIVQDVLAVLHRATPRQDGMGRRVIVASVAGNLHDLGARIVADHFEAAGWRTFFLGADTPREDLGRLAVELQADLVALSLSLGLNVRAAAQQIEAVRAATDGKVPVLLGGRVCTALPDLWRDVGADAGALDAIGAVAEAARLVAD